MRFENRICSVDIIYIKNELCCTNRTYVQAQLVVFKMVSGFHNVAGVFDEVFFGGELRIFRLCFKGVQPLFNGFFSC